LATCGAGPPALAAGFCCALAVLSEVARIVLGTATTVAVLAALAPGLDRACAVFGKIPSTVLSADATGVRRLLTVFGEIASIAGMLLFGHSHRRNPLWCGTGSYPALTSRH
jgi:hypothetical protein